MNAKRKIEKLKRKLKRCKVKHRLAISDLLVLQEAETYRANVAEVRLQLRIEELNELKVKLLHEQFSKTKISDATENNTVQSIPIVEVSAGTPASETNGGSSAAACA